MHLTYLVHGDCFFVTAVGSRIFRVDEKSREQLD